MIVLEVYGAPESFLQSRPIHTSFESAIRFSLTKTGSGGKGKRVGLTVTCDLGVLVLFEGDLYLTTETLTLLNHCCRGMSWVC